MAPAEFHTKRSFWLLRAVGAIAFAAVCAMFLRAPMWSAGWWFSMLGVTFFGTGAVVGLVQGLRREPRLTLDAHGIHDRTLGVGVIAWADIVQAEPYGVAGQPFVGLNVRDPAKYLARASAFKRMLARLNSGAGAHFSVNLAGVDADPMHVVELIMSNAGTQGERSPGVG